MRKVFIDKDYIKDLGLKYGEVFICKKHYILSSYAKDYFSKEKIKVEKSQLIDNSAKEEILKKGNTVVRNTLELGELKERIKNILRSDYGLKEDYLEKVANRILDKIK